MLPKFFRSRGGFPSYRDFAVFAVLAFHNSQQPSQKLCSCCPISMKLTGIVDNMLKFNMWKFEVDSRKKIFQKIFENFLSPQKNFFWSKNFFENFCTVMCFRQFWTFLAKKNFFEKKKFFENFLSQKNFFGRKIFFSKIFVFYRILNNFSEKKIFRKKNFFWKFSKS